MTEPRKVVFEIPGPPQAKQRARTVTVRKNGRPITMTYTPKETQDAERLVRGIARMWRADWQSERPIRIRYRFFLPNARRRDLDNMVKLIADALNGVVYRDDSQVVDSHERKFIDRTDPRTEVEIEELPQDEQLELGMEARSA